MTLNDKRYLKTSDIVSAMKKVQIGEESITDILTYFNIKLIPDREYELIAIDPDQLTIEVFNVSSGETYIGRIGLGDGVMSCYPLSYISHLQVKNSQLVTKDSYYFLGRQDPIIETVTVIDPMWDEAIEASLEERPNIIGGTEKTAIIKLMKISSNSVLYEQTYRINTKDINTLYSLTEGKSKHYKDNSCQQGKESSVILNSEFAGNPDSTILSVSGSRDTIVNEIYRNIKEHIKLSKLDIEALLPITNNILLIIIRDNDGKYHIVLISIGNEYSNCSQFNYVDLTSPELKNNNVIIPNSNYQSFADVIRELSLRIEEDLSSTTGFLVCDRLGRVSNLLDNSNDSTKPYFSPSFIVSRPFDETVEYIKNNPNIFRDIIEKYIGHFDGKETNSDEVLRLNLIGNKDK